MVSYVDTVQVMDKQTKVFRLPFRSNYSFKLFTFLSDFYSEKLPYCNKLFRTLFFSKVKVNSPLLFKPYQDPVDDSLLVVYSKHKVYYNEEHLEMHSPIFLDAFQKCKSKEVNFAKNTVKNLIDMFLKFMKYPRLRSNLEIKIDLSHYPIVNFQYNKYDSKTHNYLNHIDQTVNMLSYYIIFDFLSGETIESLKKKYAEELVNEVFGQVFLPDQEMLIASMFSERELKIKKTIENIVEVASTYNSKKAYYESEHENHINLIKKEILEKKKEIQNLISMTRQANILGT